MADTEAMRSDADMRAAFERDVLEGLSQPQKSIPARWLYDEAGSALFDRITGLPEYYPTRTETALLRDKAQEVAEEIGPGALVVEYGAGSLQKVRYLLEALRAPAGFAPVDISRAHLQSAVDRLKADYPALALYPVAADFMADDLGGALPAIPARRCGFFPGSTVGNLSDPQIIRFLRAARRDLRNNGGFLIGIDQPKSPDVLVPAYDDAAGVTAAFNLNVLKRANRELGAGFDLDAFSHRAVWNQAESRIEMHLVSRRAQAVTVAGRVFRFEEGETIHTENSRKIALSDFQALADQAGWRVDRVWRDPKAWFAVAFMS